MSATHLALVFAIQMAVVGALLAGARLSSMLRRKGPPRPLRTWLEWTAMVAVATVVGVGFLGAVVDVAPDPGDGPAADVLLVMFAAAAGALEGAVVGASQAWVLRDLLGPGVPRGWTAASAAGGAVAWGGCLFVNLLAPASGFGSQEWLLAFVIVGFVLGAVIGVAQWTLLRERMPNAGWWIPANGAAWVFGTGVVIAGVRLLEWAGGEVSFVALLALLGLASGLMVGGVTGLALVGLMRGRVPGMRGTISILERRAIPRRA